MNKLTLNIKTQKNTACSANQLSVYFHGLLMELVSNEYADYLHQVQENPYRQYIEKKKDNLIWHVYLLTEDAVENIGEVLLSPNFQTFKLRSLDDLEAQVLAKEVRYLSEENLSDLFYQENSTKRFALKFLTPTAFKQQGRYVFYPDLRLIFHSIIRKYNHHIDHNNEDVNEELLEEITSAIRITSYDLTSQYFKIHKVNIPAFTGTIHFSVKATDTLTNYIYTLLKFASYGGVGVKTAMGMGAVDYVAKER